MTAQIKPVKIFDVSLAGAGTEAETLGPGATPARITPFDAGPVAQRDSL